MGHIGTPKSQRKFEFKKKGLLTDLTVHQIEGLLLDHFGGLRGPNICIPNISWGIFKYEMDFCVVTPRRYLVEVEIKRSWTDFQADFKKKVYHNDPHVKKFYYCVPEAMVNEAAVTAGIDVGILYYSEHGAVWRKREPVLRNSKEIDDEMLFKLSRLAVIHYWSHRDDKIQTVDEKLKQELERTKSLFLECKADYKAVTGESWKLDYYGE